MGLSAEVKEARKKSFTHVTRWSLLGWNNLPYKVGRRGLACSSLHLSGKSASWRRHNPGSGLLPWKKSARVFILGFLDSRLWELNLCGSLTIGFIKFCDSSLYVSHFSVHRNGLQVSIKYSCSVVSVFAVSQFILLVWERAFTCSNYVFTSYLISIKACYVFWNSAMKVFLWGFCILNHTLCYTNLWLKKIYDVIICRPANIFYFKTCFIWY